ncbi:hypothetical protein A33M_0665 [Rhodovulum sp. PH10]|nr:hypothetical protein A33M_0665 [Rhodovulum sp. PH10]
MPLALAARLLLDRAGLSLGALWQVAGDPTRTPMRAAIAWWLIAAAALAGGFVVAALAALDAKAGRARAALRWIGGTALLAAMVVVAHETAMPAGLPASASVVLGLSVMLLAALLSLLGAFFATRR